MKGTHVVVDEVVDGLSSVKEVLAGVAAARDHGGQRLLPSVDAAATVVISRVVKVVLRAKLLVV